MLPLDSRTASIAPVTQMGQTQVVTLYKTGTAPKVVKLRPGEYWLCRVPDGVAGKSVQFLWCKPSDTPTNGNMALPTADAGVSNLESRDSSQHILIACDPDTRNEKTAVAVQWDGAADSTLIMTKVKG